MIQIENLAVRAGAFGMEGISLLVPAGEHATLMGKTGTGKTTLLEAVCGLRPVVEGRIMVAGRDVTRLAPGARGVGLVPQDGALFPHLTVREHLSFALEVRRTAPGIIEGRVSELANWLGLEALLDRRPAGLSGGEIQRVSLGRALSFHPQALCLDEPLSALDDDTRSEMCAVLRRVRERTGVTILHVTHNRWEANAVATLRFRLRDGKVGADAEVAGG